MPREESDIDQCIDIAADTDYERSGFRLKVLSELPDIFDVQIFAQLPLYVKKEVIKGKVIFCRDEEYLYRGKGDCVRTEIKRTKIVEIQESIELCQQRCAERYQKG